jgi:hypothetical protein
VVRSSGLSNVLPKLVLIGGGGGGPSDRPMRIRGGESADGSDDECVCWVLGFLTSLSVVRSPGLDCAVGRRESGGVGDANLGLNAGVGGHSGFV